MRHLISSYILLFLLLPLLLLRLFLPPLLRLLLLLLHLLLLLPCPRPPSSLNPVTLILDLAKIELTKAKKYAIALPWRCTKEGSAHSWQSIGMWVVDEDRTDCWNIDELHEFYKTGAIVALVPGSGPGRAAPGIGGGVERCVYPEERK